MQLSVTNNSVLKNIPIYDIVNKWVYFSKTFVYFDYLMDTNSIRH